MKRETARASTLWWILGLLVVASLVLYWPFLFGGKVLFWGTPMLQFWPWRTFAAEELQAGRLPLWNPYTGNGGPLLADHQSAVFYPLNLIFWVLPAGRALGVSLFLHAILAGVAMLALGRSCGVTWLGSTVASLAFMLSGYVVVRGAFLTEISALPWLPLIWLYGRKVAQHRRARDVVALSVLIAVQFLAGHAQTWFYSLISLALLGLWEAWRSQQDARFGARVWGSVLRALPLLLAVVWSVALAGAQFLPTLELTRMAGRAGREGWETYALQYSFWPWRLITLWMPDFFGNPASGNYWGYATFWEDAGYVGVLPALLAWFAMVTWVWRRRFRGEYPVLKHVPPLAFLAFFSLLMALGKNTPFYMFFFRFVPGFDIFQAPARWLCVHTTAVALLAGIGLDVLVRSQRLTFVCRLATAGAVTIALTTGAAQGFLPDVKATFFGPMIQFAILLALSMLLFLWGQTVREGRTWRVGTVQIGERVWGIALVLLVAVDLVYAGRLLNPAVDASLYDPETEIGAFIREDGQGRTFYMADARDTVMWEQFLDFGDYGPSSVDHWRDMREALLPDMGMVEGVSSANSFEPLVEGQYHMLIQAVEEMPREQALRLLGAMNVAYLLDPAPDLDLPLVYRSPSVNVYSNPERLPRAYVVCEAVAVPSPEQALDAVTAPGFDPAREVILEATSLPSDEPCELQEAFFLPSLPNQAKIRAILSQPGYLVLSDTFYPGWRATVDGERIQILRANGAFRAVALEAGTHEVWFQYRPRSFVTGVVCSVAALAGALLVWFVLSPGRLRSSNQVEAAERNN